MKEKIDKFICALLLTLIVIPGIMVNFEVDKKSYAENRLLNNFPGFLNINELLTVDETYTSSVGKWFNDHIGFREELYNIGFHFKQSFICKSSNENVHIGKDGWLFLKNDNNLELAYKNNLSNKELEMINDNLMSLKNRLNSRGIEMYLCLTPSKVSIYPEYINGNFEVRDTNIDIVNDYIKNHGSINIIRVKEELLKEKENNHDFLYHKTDSHWNTLGEYCAYKKIYNTLKNDSLINTKQAEIIINKDSKIYDLTKLLGIEEKTVDYDSFEIVDDKSIEVAVEDMYNISSNQKNSFDIDSLLINNECKNKKVLLACDSFFLHSMKKLLSQHFSEVMTVYSYSISDDLLDIYNPDIVIFERTERLIDNLKDLSSINVVINGDIIDIYLTDYGKFTQVSFPFWSYDESNQSDIKWYEGERISDDKWHVTVNRDDHLSENSYCVDAYDFTDNSNPQYICRKVIIID